MSTEARLNCMAPFFIVDDLQKSIEFYRAKLGFQVTATGGGDGTSDDYWGMVERDAAMLFLKAITPEIHPQPNHTRHEWARWDAYVNTPDPDALYAEYTGKTVPIHKELADTSDGLRAFEILDNSGYVICFGKPRDAGENAV